MPIFITAIVAQTYFEAGYLHNFVFFAALKFFGSCSESEMIRYSDFALIQRFSENVDSEFFSES